MQEITKVNILKNDDQQHADIIESTRDMFDQQGFDTVDDLSPDLFVCVGGDGTYLHHLRNNGYPTIPFVGVNAGSLGFLQEVEVHEIGQMIHDIKEGNYRIDKRGLLNIRNLGSASTELCAFNEITVAGPGARAANFELEIEGAQFSKFVGDALVFSTVQGSTAYNLGVGGPIVDPDVEVMILSPSNPFTTIDFESINSPLVLGSDVEVVVKNLDPIGRPSKIYIDGSNVEAGALDPASPISISLSGMSRYVSCLRTSKYNFYKRLARKTIRRQ